MTQSTTRTDSVPPLPSPKERRRLREARAMTEKELALALGITRKTLRSWESGRTAPEGPAGEAYARLLAAYAAELEDAGAEQPTEAPSPVAGWQPPDAPAPSAGPPPAPYPATRPAPAPTPPPAPAPATDAPSPATAPATAPSPSHKKPLNSRPVRTVTPDSRSQQDAQRRKEKAEARAGAAAAEAAKLTPAQAFDELYAHCAPALVRQTYLLTGRRTLAQESVEAAFQLAWQSWPEVAVDRDPAGWVRSAAYDYATSPWHRLRRAHRRADPADGDHDGRPLRRALLDLPPVYRRTLLLYDGLGLGLPEAAVETEATTGATGNRLVHARQAVADRLPDLENTAVLREQLRELIDTVFAPAVASAPTVRLAGERRAKFWTRLAIAVTLLIIGATAFTVVTAPTRYEPVPAPGQRVGGVPPPQGPQKLSKQDLKLRDQLRSVPVNGPGRLVPRIP
ncbi:helix-turn-helix domain-containing protein [Streptomyces sp. NPDC058653]|uniref:helix-turn-helix domain-containing protein n=1 Tax=Streptomyces sp. NPDC058653 TaxID=3346576 RepID=UPI00364B9D48